MYLAQHLRILLLLTTTAFIVVQSPSAGASAQISEFMYNAEGSDKGKEFVEIINTGNTPLRASELTLVEHGRSHGLSAVEGE